MAVGPRHKITITRRVPVRQKALELIDCAIRHALKHHKIREAQISIVIIDDHEIAELNERHLNHKGPTDVLTFDLADDLRKTVEGEIIISAETAAREAKLRNRPTATELALYAVHGTLHLLGYRDGDKLSFDKMHRVEDEIFAAMGLGSVFNVPASESPKKVQRNRGRVKRKSASKIARPTGARAT